MLEDLEGLFSSIIVVLAVLGGPLLLPVIFWLMHRQARVQDKQWEEQLEAMTEVPSILSFQACSPEMGGLSVVDYTPQQYLKLSSEREDTSGSFGFRVLLGGGLIVGGLMAGKAFWPMEDAAAKTMGLFMALTLVGAGIFVVFYRFLAPIQSVAFDGRRRRVELDRKSTRLNSSHIQKSRMPSSA